MPDTYYPQQFFEVQSAQVTITSSEVPADSIVAIPTYFDINLMSTQIPIHQEIIAQMELYAPGSLTSWPDDNKPQNRIPIYATEVATPTVTSNFPALTLAF